MSEKKKIMVKVNQTSFNNKLHVTKLSHNNNTNLISPYFIKIFLIFLIFPFFCGFLLSERYCFYDYFFEVYFGDSHFKHLFTLLSFGNFQVFFDNDPMLWSRYATRSHKLYFMLTLNFSCNTNILFVNSIHFMFI